MCLCISRKMLLVVSVGLTLLVSQGQASTVVFQDGFETYAAGTTWTPGAPDPRPAGWLDPGTPSVGNPWYVRENEAWYNVSVLTTGAYPFAAHGGSNYLHVRDDNQGERAGAQISADGQTAIANGKDLTLDMWVYKNFDGYDGSATVAGYDAVPLGTAGKAFDLYFKDDGTVEYNAGAGRISTGLTYNKADWTHLTVVADFATHTYDVTVGSNTALGLAFADNSISKIQNVILGGDGSTKAAFDDIQMTTSGAVPEPGMFTMLATGLLGLLAYAWRKRR
jgi:hypothetical protein